MSELPAGWLQPDNQTFVTAKTKTPSTKVMLAFDIEHIISFKPEVNNSFDLVGESSANQDNLIRSHIPLSTTDDLNQVNIMAFDKALRLHHGKKTLLTATMLDMVGAAVALRLGWLRARKMDTCLEKAYLHGLVRGSELEHEVTMRLLVPR